MTNNIIYDVSFPKLNINLQLSPIATVIGPIIVHWYGIIIALAFTLAYIYVNSQKKKYNLSSEDISNFTFLSSTLAIICARIYYVIFYPGDFYIKNPEEIFKISNGGIAIYGAVIGGFLGLIIYCKIKKINLLSVLDLTCIGLVLGQAIGRWGNFINQEAFGSVTNLPWGMLSSQTQFKTVHPCFLYESLGCFACFLFLHMLSNKKSKNGNIFFLYLLIYGIIRMLIENLRTDSLIIPGTAVKISSLISFILIVISSISLLINNKKNSTQ